jgi:hypothetical protein
MPCRYLRSIMGTGRTKAPTPFRPTLACHQVSYSSLVESDSLGLPDLTDRVNIDSKEGRCSHSCRIYTFPRALVRAEWAQGAVLVLLR